MRVFYAARMLQLIGMITVPLVLTLMGLGIVAVLREKFFLHK